MSEDKLVMQMLGKFNDCKLSIQTIINPTLVMESKVENIDSIIRRKMIEAIADKIYSNGKHVTFLTLEIQTMMEMYTVTQPMCLVNLN